jgi:hypothetical protein
MKTKMLFLASAFAILASGSTGAYAEGNSDACHNQYGACMERCATRPQSMQEGCSSSCESSTNACYTQMYSQQSGGQGGGTTQYRSEEGRDARDEAKPEATVTESAPVKPVHKKKHYH